MYKKPAEYQHDSSSFYNSPLEGGQGDVMGVRGVRGDVKKTWGMYKKHGNVQKTWECTKNLLNISMIVQRSTIPPLRGARGMFCNRNKQSGS